MSGSTSKEFNGVVIQKAAPSLGGVFDTASNSRTWNSPIILAHTNCYAYALNVPSTGYAVPGHLTHPDIYTSLGRLISLQKIQEFLERDGLVKVSEKNALNNDGHFIALWVQPGFDYHFARRNKIGSWSHKGGGKAVSWRDDFNRQIKIPELSYFQNYQEFGGYFELPESGVEYIPWLNFENFGIAA